MYDKKRKPNLIANFRHFDEFFNAYKTRKYLQNAHESKSSIIKTYFGLSLGFFDMFKQYV